MSEIYCDGLGACLGSCPQGAITVEKREAADFDEKATEKYQSELAEQNRQQQSSKERSGEFVCPGMAMKSFERKASYDDGGDFDVPSQLTQWPVQLRLVNPSAPYFKNADLLVAADCVAFAMGDFHNKLLKGKAVVIVCPKLDDKSGYVEQLTSIIRSNNLKSITVAHMEVPCCFGIVALVDEAIKQSNIKIGFEDITIALDGQIK